MSSLIIDNREKQLIDFFASDCDVQQLNIGDVHIYYNNELEYIIERKTVRDLASSIKDGRLKEQQARLSNFDSSSIIYIIEGNLNTMFANLKIGGIPTTTLQTCLLQLSLQYKFAVIQTDTFEHTAQVIQKILKKMDKFHTDRQSFNRTDAQKNTLILQNCGKKMTKDVCYISMLCQIPGISLKIGKALSHHFPTMNDLCEAFQNVDDPESILKDIILSTNEKSGKKRRIGPVLANRIFQYISQTENPSLVSGST